MATLATAARVILGTPGIENAEGKISIVPHIMNVGDASISNVQCTDITLSSAVRISPPAGIPVVIGLIEAPGVGNVVARFSNAGLTVGAKYLLTVRVTYTISNVVYGLTLNRYIQIPPAANREVPQLNARVETSTAPNVWNYTLSNNETPGRDQYIATFSLAIAAPVTITGTPPGWAVETDGLTFVLWYADDLVMPYPHQVAPGQTLGGFQLSSPRLQSEASACTLVAWNHTTDAGDLITGDYAITPYRFG